MQAGQSPALRGYSASASAYRMQAGQSPAVPGPYGPGTIFFCFALKRLNTGAINGL